MFAAQSAGWNFQFPERTVTRLSIVCIVGVKVQVIAGGRHYCHEWTCNDRF